MKRVKVFTLGMVLCLSLAVLTGCGQNDTKTEEETNDSMVTEDVDTDDRDKNQDKPVNDTTAGTAMPEETNHDNIGDDLVDTVDDVGTDIVDGVTDVGRDLTGDDSGHTSPSPSATTSSTAMP